MATLLELDGLVVRRGSRFALSPISLQLTDNSGIVGLFGQNGAGKTTLLKAVAGLLRYQEGKVFTRDGKPPVFLPDQPYLYDFLRVSECPEIFSRYFADFSIKVAQDILADLKLDPAKNVCELSRGMLDQLSLGLMLARRADVYLFDEPLAAVDPATRDIMLQLIAHHRPPGSTIVISTHLIGGLEGLFDECIVMHEGRLLLHQRVEEFAADGTLEESFKKVVRHA